MSRRNLVAIAAPACAALVAAGVAAASHHRAQSMQAASATFNAASVTRSNAKTCTTGSDAYADTTATYTGTASSSDARLTGPLMIRARSVVNTTTGLGWATGTFRVGSGKGSAHGNLQLAIAGGKAVGTIVGRTERESGKLLASLSATFTAKDGFSSGALGSGSASGAGVVFQNGTCTRAAAVHSVFVSHLRFTTKAVVPAVSGKDKARGDGTFTLDVTRDANGAISSAKAVFYVNYHFDGAATITGLALHQGARGAQGAVVLDSGVGTTTDPDGNGNLTQVVNGVSPSLAQAVLANPKGYYVELTTSTTALRAQLGGFARR